MKSFRLSDVLSIDSRFGRSINLERDFYSDLSIDGYVVTSTTLRALSRLTAAMRAPGSCRAWTLTGPYGSGKSTFGLFVGKLFDIRETLDSQKARNLLQDTDRELWFSLFSGKTDTPKLLPILVSGSREPISRAILRGIKGAINRSDIKSLTKLGRKVEALETSENISGRQLVELVDSIAKALRTSEVEVGILLVIDELGKLLEYSTIENDSSDIFILQELAEAANDPKRNMFVVTALHQAFDQYASRLAREDREEWLKIQGRYEDVAFQEPNEQILHILKGIFTEKAGLESHELMSSVGTRLAQKAYSLGLCGNLDEELAVSLLRNTTPLHPLVSLTIGSVFRRFGQNERSLFAFLTSNEPFGFREFLSRTKWDESRQPVLTLDYLYDYLISSMGSSLYAGPDARKWTEIESAIDRLGSAADPLTIQLLKIIGLLRITGEIGNIKSSRDLLAFSLFEPGVNDSDINSALDRLVEKSIVVERRFNDTFAIWEGSDINVEDRIRDAERHVERSIPLATFLKKNFRLRPVVAKRHSHETGTLRYFDIDYVDPKDLLSVPAVTTPNSDGRIVYILPNDKRESESLAGQLTSPSNLFDESTVYVILERTELLRDWVYRDACCRWVRMHTPELEGDRAARLELAAQQNIAEQAILSWIGEIHNSANSQRDRWFWKGKELLVSGPRELQSELSRIFDDLYQESPKLLNELVNRSTLSSAAVVARKQLLEAMVAHPQKDQLGIEGFPPQLSIYLSVLANTSLHRSVNGVYGFYPPAETSDDRVKRLWGRIEAFIFSTEDAKQPVSGFFHLLSSRPLGIKAGLHPIFLAVALLHFESELALYEHGNFVPRLSLPVFERLIRNPSNFELHFCKIAGSRADALHHMIQVFARKDIEIDPATQKLDLLTLVRPLALFASSLDAYTKSTTSISEPARRIRQALLSAREPDRLLFKLLPEACGFDEFTADTVSNHDSIVSFSQILFDGIGEIKRAREHLLGRIELMIKDSFHSIHGGEALREDLARRSGLVERHVADRKVKSFVIRSQNTDEDYVIWLESLAALFVGKPTKTWSDEDVDRLQVNVTDVARSFVNLERVVFAFEELKGERKDSNLLRLSLTRLGDTEHERVLAISDEERSKIESIEELIEKTFEQSGLNGNLELRLSVLASLSLKIMDKDDKENAKQASNGK
jgi:hypothetical protein